MFFAGRRVWVVVSLMALLPSAASSAARSSNAVQIDGSQGLAALLTTSGDYTISVPSPAWKMGGKLGAVASNLTTTNGRDAVGPYYEIGFDYRVDTIRHGTIRAYTNHIAVLFSVTYDGAAQNSAPFPTLSRFPSMLGHLTFSGSFSVPSFVSFSGKRTLGLFRRRREYGDSVTGLQLHDGRDVLEFTERDRMRHRPQYRHSAGWIHPQHSAGD